MKVLVICNHGKNRSTYLAEYLRNKGYSVITAGALNDGNLGEKIQASDTIIIVHSSVWENLKDLDLSQKRVIELDVEDRPEKILGIELDGDPWDEFQKEYVYPELEKQMDKLLPL